MATYGEHKRYHYEPIDAQLQLALMIRQTAAPFYCTLPPAADRWHYTFRCNFFDVRTGRGYEVFWYLDIERDLRG